MELKRVSTNNVQHQYAKMGEVSKKDLKNAMPHKWIVSGIIGAFVATYSSFKEGILKIGIVIGCISIDKEGDTRLNDAGSRINTIENLLLTVFIGSVLISIIYLIDYLRVKKSIGVVKKQQKVLRLFVMITIIFGVAVSLIEIYSSANQDKFVLQFHNGEWYTLEELKEETDL